MVWPRDRRHSGTRAGAGVIGFVLAAGALAIDEHDSGRDLATYVRLALAKNPAVRAARNDVAAAREAQRLAVSLPDPSLSAGYFISEVETRVGPQQAKVGASQKLPWPGKLVRRREAAAEGLRVAREKQSAVEAEVFWRLRAEYSGLYAAGRAIAVNNENLKLLEHIESVLLSQYATAEVSQASVLKIQVERAKLGDRIESLKSRERTHAEEIRALVGGDTSLVIQTPARIESLTVDTSGLGGAAKQVNPSVLMSLHKAREAAARARLARQGWLPDFMVMTDYIITRESHSSMVSSAEDGKDPWAVGLSVTLPLWVGKKSSEIRSAESVAASQRARWEHAENVAAATAVSLTEDLADARRRIHLLEDVLVPKARQTLSLVQEAY
ncbi:MAG: hypothetical protein GF410_16935, partial [Chitinivibrionales bacterium]|nr:hypothetical protein [Chitinivibrionales bacterium]